MNFAEYYQTFFTRIYNYARYRASGPQEAEDLTAYIFEKLYTRFDSFDPQKAPLEAWTFILAGSATTDYFRRKKIRQFFSFTQEQEETLSSRDASEDLLEKSEDERRLHQALSQLSDKEKELVNLHYYQGLKQREIAAVTGLTQSHAGVILHRAVQKLKKLLEMNYDAPC